MCSFCALTTWSGARLEKLSVSQLVKKFSALYATRGFTAVIKSSRAISHASLKSSELMEAEKTTETVDSNSMITRVIARKDFTAFSSRESLMYYIAHHCLNKRKQLAPVQSQINNPHPTPPPFL
jgi:hypothetical protein